MYSQQALPTIREGVLYDDLEEVHDKYFGRSQSKIVQGMTAKEKRPGGQVVKKDKGNKWDVKSVRLSSIGEDNFLQEDLDIEDIMAKEKRACLHGRKIKKAKSISLCVIKEDDDLKVEMVDEDIIAKEKRACLHGRKKKNIKNFSLSLIEEDGTQETETIQEDDKMPSLAETESLPESCVQRLDLTVETTTATAQSVAGAFAPQPTRETQISAFVPKEKILSSENIEVTKSFDMLTTEHKDNVETPTEEIQKSRIHKLQELLDILEIQIKNKTAYLSAPPEMALKDLEYKNQLRDIYRKSTQCYGDLNRGKTQGKIENKLGHEKIQADPKKEKIDSKIDKRETRAHSDQVVHEIIKILDKARTGDGNPGDPKKEKSNHKHNASLKDSRSVQHCGGEPSTNRQKMRQKRKESKEISALMSESPYAESMRCKEVHLPRMKLSPHQKGEPVFPPAQSKKICKLPPIQGSKQTSSPALAVCTVSDRSLNTLSPMVPRTPSRQEGRPTCALRVPASPVPRQVSPGHVVPAAARSMIRTGSGTPSTPLIRSPLMNIPTTSQDIRKCLQARKNPKKT